MFIVSHVQFKCAATGFLHATFPASRNTGETQAVCFSQTEKLKSRNRKFFKSHNFLTQDVWFDLKRLSAFKLCPVGYLWRQLTKISNYEGNVPQEQSSDSSESRMDAANAQQARTASHSSFVDLLPPEVTCKIFSQLDIQSLCRASETCQSWNHTIINNDALWKPHCLTARAVCPREINGDIEHNYTWRVSFTSPCVVVLRGRL